MTDTGTTDDDTHITADDVMWLNQAMVERAAAFVRIAGTVLVVVGAIAVAASLWSMWEQQRDLGELPSDASVFDDGELGRFLGEAPEPSLGGRVDHFVTTFSLTEPALALAVGLGLRLFADYTVARTGGSLTGYEAGEEVPPETDEDLDA